MTSLRPAALLSGVAVRGLLGGATYLGLATGAAPLDLGVGRRTCPLGPLQMRIDVPREMVFEVLRAPYGERGPPQLLRPEKVEVCRGLNVALTRENGLNPLA